MPFWGWILLIAGLSALAVAAFMAVIHATHRLPAEEPLEGDHTNFAAPLPIDVAAADELTAREVDTDEAQEAPVR